MEYDDRNLTRSERVQRTDENGSVIVMKGFQKENSFTAIQQISAYWEALRGSRLMPKRSEIDPRGIEQALENAFVLERITPGVTRLRIAGSHLNELMGMEVRGMPITSFFGPAHRTSVNSLLEDVFERPAVADLTLMSNSNVGCPHLNARMLLMPMKSDLGDVSRILGGLVAKGEIGRQPRRFEIVETKIRLLKTTFEPCFETSTYSKKKHLNYGFSETNRVLEPKTGNRTVPHLRLVPNDK